VRTGGQWIEERGRHRAAADDRTMTGGRARHLAVRARFLRV